MNISSYTNAYNSYTSAQIYNTATVLWTFPQSYNASSQLTLLIYT